MKHLLYIVAFALCLVGMSSCEKTMLVADNETSDGQTTGGGSSTASKDSTAYPDSDSDDGLETDIKDGNTDEDKEEKKEDTPAASTTYTIYGETAYSVDDFINNYFSGAIWVVGYIVGDCTQSKSNANLDAPFNQPQAILLADNPDERDLEKMMAVQLSSTSRREKYSLKSHPENKGTKLFAICGDKRSYLGFYGMKSEKSGIASMGWYEEYTH